MAGSRTHWFADPNLSESTSELTAENLTRARALRLHPGESLVLTNGRGLEALCEVTRVDREQVSFSQRELNQRAKPLGRILVQALTKHDPIEAALRLSTEFGITSLMPWQANRSVTRLSEMQAVKQQARLAAVAREQSLLNHLPWFPTVDTLRPRVIKPEGVGFLLTPEAGVQLADFIREPGKSAELASSAVTFVVGPEGGITDSELSEAVSLGYIPVSLGGVSFRSVSAGAAALALLGALTLAPRM